MTLEDKRDDGEGATEEIDDHEEERDAKDGSLLVDPIELGPLSGRTQHRTREKNDIMDRLVMSARTVVITEGLTGELLRSRPYQECQKNCTPTLPAEVPRLYAGYILDTQKYPPFNSHARNQRRWSNRIHVRGEPTRPLLRARLTAPACHRARQRTTRASVRSSRSTGIRPSRAARRGRGAAAGR